MTVSYLILVSLTALCALEISGLKVTLFKHAQYESETTGLAIFDTCADGTGISFRPRSLKLFDSGKISPSPWPGELCIKLWQGTNCTGSSYVAIGDQHDLTAVSDNAQSFSSCAFNAGSDPPLLWKEHWHEHNKDLERVFFDNDIAVYYDSAVNRSVTWPFKYIGDIWRYTKATYGNFGTDNRLFAVLHHGQYYGAHMSTHMSATHDYHPVIDCSLRDGRGWESGPFWDSHQTLLHEIGRIVENSAKGVMGAPIRGIWTEAWVRLFTFDVFVAVGMKEDADLIHASATKEEVTLQGHRVPVFKNWLYPIYRDHGGSEVMNNFLTLLSENFPTSAVDAKWREYSREMNYGELVHFWSGAARMNLNNLANATFPPVYIEQLKTARFEFPAIVCDEPEEVCKIVQISKGAAESATQAIDQEEKDFSATIYVLIAWGVLTTVALAGMLGYLLVLHRRKKRMDGSYEIELLHENERPANRILY